MTLFDEWLSETKQLQEESFGHQLPKGGADLIEWIRINTLAATDELHEALNETGWKPWATTTHVNREAFIGEVVDALHFIGNLLAGVGCTDSELSAAYYEKMDRNAQRQSEGYTGLDKCIGCGRDGGDVRAHGGLVFPISGNKIICDECNEKG